MSKAMYVCGCMRALWLSSPLWLPFTRPSKGQSGLAPFLCYGIQQLPVVAAADSGFTYVVGSVWDS